MKFKELKEDFESGKITKHDYIALAYKEHENLFMYAELLKSTRIDRIEIIEGKVLMHSRDCDFYIECPWGDHRVPPIEVLNFGSYEQEEIDMMLRLITSGDTVFDIGANIGWFTLYYAVSFPESKVFAFEPIKQTFNYLENNLAYNSVRNVSSFNIGFGTEECIQDFYFTPRVSGATSKTFKQDFPDAEKCECRVRTLDNFISDTGVYPDVIKCDVEGAELFVYQGAQKMLRTSPPVILSEMLRKWAASFNYHPNDIIRLLLGYGYGCFVIKDGRLSRISEVTEYTVETNFVFLHDEKHTALKESLE